MSPEVSLPMNTVWVVMAAVLVFFMQAGFALVESGMVRAKNSVNVILKNYSDMCVGGVVFWLVGYGVMFGLNKSGWFGTTKFALNSAENWEFTQMFFQMMFAATAATIVSGALAERIRFSAYLVGSMVITSLIYPVFGCWAWNEGGWLKKLGFLDFAGSTVVHSLGAWCSLAGLLVLGQRTGRFTKEGKPRNIPGHNQPFVALGGLILWFGWFGFNAGSTVEANADLGKIALNTHLAGAAAVAMTILMSALTGKPPLLGTIVNASLGGLVGITAGCAYVGPSAAIAIGAVAAVLVPIGNKLLDRLRIDDAVGAIPVHGLCGVWGTLAVACFKDGTFNLSQLGIQAIGVGVAMAFVIPTAFLMYIVIGLFIPLRVDTVDEQRGLDHAEHNEVAYPEFVEGVMHSGTSATVSDNTDVHLHVPHQIAVVGGRK